MQSSNPILISSKKKSFSLTNPGEDEEDGNDGGEGSEGPEGWNDMLMEDKNDGSGMDTKSDLD